MPMRQGRCGKQLHNNSARMCVSSFRGHLVATCRWNRAAVALLIENQSSCVRARFLVCHACTSLAAQEWLLPARLLACLFSVALVANRTYLVRCRTRSEVEIAEKNESLTLSWISQGLHELCRERRLDEHCPRRPVHARHVISRHSDNDSTAGWASTYFSASASPDVVGSKCVLRRRSARHVFAHTPPLRTDWLTT